MRTSIIEENARSRKFTVKKEPGMMEVYGRKKDGTTEFAVYSTNGKDEARLIVATSPTFATMIESGAGERSPKKTGNPNKTTKAKPRTIVKPKRR